MASGENPAGDEMITLNVSDQPRVSILIPSRSQHELLENCLKSLRRHIGRDIAYEVIIVLNAANDAVKSFVRERTQGPVVLESTANLGVAGGYNRARNAARGEFLLLLHDDTEVLPGWIENLLQTIAANPAAGAVGSFQFFPDGRPQRAGSILWQNAVTSTTWGDGRPDPGVFTEIRAVDYIGTCSTLVRTATWDLIGGMDEEIFPAYYVDVDLCMNIHRHGQTVLCDPRSRLLHHQGASTNRKFQQFINHCNQIHFVGKWSAELALHEPYAPEDPAAIGRAQQITARIAAELATNWRGLPIASSVPPFLDPEIQEREHLKREQALLSKYQKHLEAGDAQLTDWLATANANLATTHEHLVNTRTNLMASQEELTALRAKIRKLKKRCGTLESELPEQRKNPLMRLIGKLKARAGGKR